MYSLQATTNIQKELFALEENPLKLMANKSFLLVLMVLIPIFLSTILLIISFNLQPLEIILPLGLGSILLLNIYLWYINQYMKKYKLMIGFSEIKILIGGKTSAVTPIENIRFETIEQVALNNQIETLIKIEAPNFPRLLISKSKISRTQNLFNYQTFRLVSADEWESLLYTLGNI